MRNADLFLSSSSSPVPVSSEMSSTLSTHVVDQTDSDINQERLQRIRQRRKLRQKRKKERRSLLAAQETATTDRFATPIAGADSQSSIEPVKIGKKRKRADKNDQQLLHAASQSSSSSTAPDHGSKVSSKRPKGPADANVLPTASNPAKKKDTAREVDPLKERVRAGQFRWINEQLYSTSSSDAVDFFAQQNGSELFKIVRRRHLFSICLVSLVDT